MSGPEELRYSATVVFRGGGRETQAVGWGATRDAAVDHARLQVERRWPEVAWRVLLVSTIDSIYADLTGGQQLPRSGSRA